MKRGLVIVLLFAALVALQCGTEGQQDTTEIKKVISEFHRAFDARDYAGMRDLCTDDMYWYTLDGRALARDKMAEFFAPMTSRWTSIKTTLKEMEIFRIKNLAWARYKSEITIQVGDNNSTMQNLHTIILKQQDGAWKIWQHHMSTK